MNLMLTQSTRASLVQFYSALRQAVWEIVRAENYSAGPVDFWETSTKLNCRSCDEVVVGVCALATWVEFDQTLKRQEFKCACGGVLTRDSALIKIAP